MFEVGQYRTTYLDLTERLYADGWSFVPVSDTEWKWECRDSQGNLIGWEGSDRYKQIQEMCITEKVWEPDVFPFSDDNLF